MGIVSAIGQASRYGVKTLLRLAAYLTINIGVLNLLPIPMLDGGRAIMEIAGEILPRNRWTRRAMAALLAASVFFLLLLMVFITWQDLTRMFV